MAATLRVYFVFAFALLFALPVLAQEGPKGPIKRLVGFEPGGCRASGRIRSVVYFLSALRPVAA